MRGCEKSRLKTACGKHGRQHAGHRALSVGSRYMNNLELPVRMTCQLVKNQHVLNARLIRRCARLLKGREPAEEVLEHALILFFCISSFHKSSKTFVVTTKILIFTNFITKISSLAKLE